MRDSLTLRDLLRHRLFSGAAALVVIAAVVLVVAIVGAVRVEPVQAAAPPAAIPDSALRFAPAGAGADVAAAVAADIFADDRRPPRRRYLMPGESDAGSAAPAPRPVVLGTAITGGAGSFAICQVPGGQPTVVRAGGQIGGYTVVSIERGKVTFRGSDGERFSIDASKPVP